MKEDFLHYLWKYKKFDTSALCSTSFQSIVILHAGDHLQTAGPDFFNAQLLIGDQKWAGNVEIHLRSSDWYVHGHEKDPAYDTVILHVVWEHNTPILRKDNTEIPTLELKGFVDKDTLVKYELLLQAKSWINCENQLSDMDGFVLRNWQERLYFERLERKYELIQSVLQLTENDWEAALFCLLARSFGSNTNGSAFFAIAMSIPFSVIRKERNSTDSLEALLLGMAGLLDDPKEDVYFRGLASTFGYLSKKYHLAPSMFEPIQFFRLRPDNFPTIRLSQLANLYTRHTHLFSLIIAAESVEQLYQIFEVSASHYWQNHYQFDHPSVQRKKTLSRSFIDLIIINTIMPIRFAYAQSRGADNTEEAIVLLERMKAEKNNVIQKFEDIGVPIQNAFQTQALLQLKQEYCDKGKCLECAIGVELLKSNK